MFYVESTHLLFGRGLWRLLATMTASTFIGKDFSPALNDRSLFGQYRAAARRVFEFEAIVSEQIAAKRRNPPPGFVPIATEIRAEACPELRQTLRADG